MENIYTSGKYLEATKSWHAEDAKWKARQIKTILDRNKIQLQTVAEIGCGSGSILKELSKFPDLAEVNFQGYDISPQAIGIAKQMEGNRLHFFQENLLARTTENNFDALLAIDVFEHVPDFMGFLEGCRKSARLKIYHVPLDLHVSSVLRNAFLSTRYTIGHIHYFTADSAISAIKDTGHEVVDCMYTNIAFGLFSEHPSLKKFIANVPRWLLSNFSVPLSARVLGGYSLLVLAR